MKVGLLICTYNRPEYLKQCLDSLKLADLSKINQILIVDDASNNQEVINLLRSSSYEVIVSLENKGIRHSLLTGYSLLFGAGNGLVINLDSDAIVRHDFIDRLIENYIHGTLLTGFHCTTKNSDGSERHKIINETKNHYIKQSVGGINFCIDKLAYENFVKPSLNIIGNWDHNSCIKAGKAYCLKESIVQHIGFNSSMNHIEQPDIADGFYYLSLSDVTLLGIDNQPDRLNKAEKKCTEFIKFGNVVKLNPDIRSKEAYSEFLIKEGYKHVKTSHCLIFQHDGFVNNYAAWDDSWLQYDYIGAPWHYQDGMAVGNGGFSLRSKKLMKIIATDKHIEILHPEDHHICRTYRPYLEQKYGIKFAPLEVAERFSYEGYLQPGKVLSDQFGVHGSNPRTNIQQPPIQQHFRPERYVFNQFRGLGDILFLVPLCRALMREGNTVIWPIASEFMDITKHFPDIDFRDMATMDLPYERQSVVDTEYGKFLPYRFAAELMHRGPDKWMVSKYEIYNHSYLMWRELSWKRDYKKEQELINLVGATGKYTLINRDFADPKFGLRADIPNKKGKVIEMRVISGFSIIDWCGVIELASEIHTVNTAINYLIELMNIKVPVYMYKRNVNGEVGFEHTRELWLNKCWRFVE